MKKSIVTLAGDAEKGRDILSRASEEKGLDYMDTRVNDEVFIIEAANRATSNWFVVEAERAGLKSSTINID